MSTAIIGLNPRWPPRLIPGRAWCEGAKLCDWLKTSSLVSCLFHGETRERRPRRASCILDRVAVVVARGNKPNRVPITIVSTRVLRVARRAPPAPPRRKLATTVNSELLGDRVTDGMLLSWCAGCLPSISIVAVPLRRSCSCRCCSCCFDGCPSPTGGSTRLALLLLLRVCPDAFGARRRSVGAVRLPGGTGFGLDRGGRC